MYKFLLWFINVANLHRKYQMPFKCGHLVTSSSLVRAKACSSFNTHGNYVFWCLLFKWLVVERHVDSIISKNQIGYFPSWNAILRRLLALPLKYNTSQLFAQHINISGMCPSKKQKTNIGKETVTGRVSSVPIPSFSFVAFLLISNVDTSCGQVCRLQCVYTFCSFFSLYMCMFRSVLWFFRDMLCVISWLLLLPENGRFPGVLQAIFWLFCPMKIKFEIWYLKMIRLPGTRIYYKICRENCIVLCYIYWKSNYVVLNRDMPTQLSKLKTMQLDLLGVIIILESASQVSNTRKIDNHLKHGDLRTYFFRVTWIMVKYAYTFCFSENQPECFWKMLQSHEKKIDAVPFPAMGSN